MKPTSERTPASYWFIFRSNELLVKLNDDSVSIPFISDLSELRLNLGSIKQNYFGLLGKNHCYFLDVLSEIDIPEDMSFYDLRSLYKLLKEDFLWIAGRAFQLLNWDRTTQYCGQCAIPTELNLDEKGKKCPQCGLLNFPRISPAIIVGVLKGDQILLANGTRFPSRLFSIIAGFVEPGENLEECVRREIKEEVGLEIENIRYFGSQAWPFPDSLMIGFIADYSGGEITIDKTEINDADWYTSDNLPPIPSKISIARKIIDWFIQNH
jgi:NAD+ diphosphatase